MWLLARLLIRLYSHKSHCSCTEKLPGVNVCTFVSVNRAFLRKRAWFSVKLPWINKAYVTALCSEYLTRTTWKVTSQLPASYIKINPVCENIMTVVVWFFSVQPFGNFKYLHLEWWDVQCHVWQRGKHTLKQFTDQLTKGQFTFSHLS